MTTSYSVYSKLTQSGPELVWWPKLASVLMFVFIVVFIVLDGGPDLFMDEEEHDDEADVSDEDLAGDGDAADQKNKSRQMQVKQLYFLTTILGHVFPYLFGTINYSLQFIRLLSVFQCPTWPVVSE